MLLAKSKTQAAPTFEGHSNGSPNDPQRREHSAVELMPDRRDSCDLDLQTNARNDRASTAGYARWLPSSKQIGCIDQHLPS